jgi:hypothetical protein
MPACQIIGIMQPVASAQIRVAKPASVGFGAIRWRAPQVDVRRCLLMQSSATISNCSTANWLRKLPSGRADVVAVYILPTMLKKVAPKFNKLRPGTRFVSHAFAIPGIKPAKVTEMTSEDDDVKRKVYLYTVPLVEAK